MNTNNYSYGNYGNYDNFKNNSNSSNDKSKNISDNKKEIETLYKNLLTGFLTSIVMADDGEDGFKRSMENSKEFQDTVKQTKEAFDELANKLDSMNKKSEDDNEEYNECEDEKLEPYFYIGTRRFILFNLKDDMVTYLADDIIESITKDYEGITRIATKGGEWYEIVEPYQTVLDKISGLYREGE